MKQKSLWTLLATAAVAGLIASCGGGQPSETTTAPAAPAGGGRTVDSATAGSVTGTVKLNGTPPRMRPINMAADPVCARLHATPVTTENVVVGEGGALRNVVVYLSGGELSSYSFPTPSAPVTLDQHGCEYMPHVIAVMVNQPLHITNSDQTTHNIHPVPRNNREWNESQPPGAAPLMQSFAREEVAIPVKCNVHPWMQSYVAVLNHPYFQVTGENGAFNLSNVPPGTYTAIAWHETYGTREQSVTVPASGSATVEFTFDATSAGSD